MEENTNWIVLFSLVNFCFSKFHLVSIAHFLNFRFWYLWFLSTDNLILLHLLQHLDITFRRDPTNYRPRINKLDSTKDREQKSAGSYYYLDDWCNYWQFYIVLTLAKMHALSGSILRYAYVFANQRRWQRFSFDLLFLDMQNLMASFWLVLHLGRVVLIVDKWMDVFRLLKK